MTKLRTSITIAVVALLVGGGIGSTVGYRLGAASVPAVTVVSCTPVKPPMIQPTKHQCKIDALRIDQHTCGC